MTHKSETSAKLSLENIMHIAICIGILAFFFMYSVLPVYRQYEVLNTKVSIMNCDQTEHTVLFPFYAALKTKLDQPKIDALIAIENMPLCKEDFAAMHELIQGISEECGLTLLKTAPHVQSVSDERRFLGVNISVEGAFSKMRMFLQAIMQMPSFFHLERLKITNGVDDEQLDIQIWLSVK